MKAALLCTLLLLAGAYASSPAIESDSIKAWAADAKLKIPDWIIILIEQLPDSIQTIIDRLPEIISAIPGIVEQIPAIIEAIVQKIPEIIPVILEKLPEIIGNIIDKIPEIIPIILDKIPEIIAQIPAAIEKIKEIIITIIQKIPELIPIILEKIPEIIAAIPEIIEKIKEVLESFEVPDWFPTLPDLEKPEWWPELPSLPEINKPVRGIPANIEEFPGIAQIEVGTGPIWVQGCAGNIMTSLHVLTSARCVSGRQFSTRFRRVRAGSSSRFTGGSISTITRVIIHPYFIDDGRADADIAILRLNSGFVLSPTIQQTAIVPQDYSIPAGLTLTLAGWGSTAEGKLISNRNLYKIDLTIGDSTTCAERWALSPRINITDNIICLGRPETGGRNGDIRDLGAPVYIQGILAAIFSLGVPVGNSYYPILTTSIAPYSDWIVSNAI